MLCYNKISIYANERSSGQIYRIHKHVQVSRTFVWIDCYLIPGEPAVFQP